MHTFSVADSIRFGWGTFKKRPLFFIAIMFLVTIAGGIISMISAVFAQGGVAGVLIGDLANWTFNVLIGMGTVAFFLKAHDNVDVVQSTDFWHPYPFWSYVAASLLALLVVIGGFILLIIPGVIFSIMFMFSTYIVIDHNTGPIEAMKESKRIVRGHKWALLVFAIAIAGINVLGFLCLIVGLLVTLPITTLATAHAYRTLSKTAHV